MSQEPSKAGLMEPIQAQVVVTKPNEEATSSEHVLGLIHIPQNVHPVRARVAIGRTVRFGSDFEFLRVDVSLEAPIVPSDPEVEQMMERMQKWVARKADAVIDRLHQELPPARQPAPKGGPKRPAKVDDPFSSR